MVPDDLSVVARNREHRCCPRDVTRVYVAAGNRRGASYAIRVWRVRTGFAAIVSGAAVNAVVFFSSFFLRLQIEGIPRSLLSRSLARAIDARETLARVRFVSKRGGLIDRERANVNAPRYQCGLRSFLFHLSRRWWIYYGDSALDSTP